MNDYALSNRRAEPRFYYRSGVRIAWRVQSHGARTRRGWLGNTSASGVAFLARGDRLPQLGDDVTLRLADGVGGRLYHVVRVGRMSTGLVVLGCRAGPAAAAMMDAPEGLTDTEHRRQPESVDANAGHKRRRRAKHAAAA